MRAVYTSGAIAQALRDGQRLRESSPEAVANYADGGRAVAIIGARKQEQLDDNLGVTAVTVPPEIVARLEKETAPSPEYPGAFIDFIQSWLGNR